MELKRKDTVDFMTGTLTPSTIAGFSGWGSRRLSKKVT
jgi:hypothetical protein